MRTMWSIIYWLCFVVVVKASLSPGKNDASTLLSIIGDLGYSPLFEKSWKGTDPCQNWYGISCIEGQIHAITFMFMNLSGIISPRFADLTSVSIIDLSHNQLTGTIPFELTTLDMIILDVSYNHLRGKVPRFRKTFLNVAGNPEIETNQNVPSQPSNRMIIVGISFGIMAVASLLIGGGFTAFYFLRVKRSDGQTEATDTVVQTLQSVEEHIEMVEVEASVISMQILRDATEDFCSSNIVGRGVSAAVYKGRLPNGAEVAVKRMYQPVIVGDGLEQFRSEVRLLRTVLHRNLVVFHGYCLEGNERLLVYQFMPHGTLSKHLFNWKKEGLSPLDWSMRLTVALDVARGVEYMHTLAYQNQSYIHRDLKPSNILLGHDKRAKVSDFGFVRAIAEGRESVITKCVGTFGYIAPEYTMTGHVSTKVDVYSYGVILMELITGRKAIDMSQPEEVHIATWFRKTFVERDSLVKVIDETIEVNEEIRGSFNEVAELAIQCCANEPEQRPEMSHVVTVLASLAEHWKPGSEVKEVRHMDDTKLSELVQNWKKELQLEAGSSSTTVV